MKPSGLEMVIRDGSLRIGVTRSSRVEDAIWKAVEEARDAHITVEQFRNECAEAWEHYSHEQMKHDRDAWRPR